MTFQEYIEQKEPRKLPVGSVEVSRGKAHIYRESSGTGVRLEVGGQMFCYVLPANSIDNILFTMDSDGNPRKRTVFRLV